MTSLRFRVRSVAQRDLEAYADHLLAEAGAEVAMRFINQANATFTALGNAPKIGPPVPSRDARLGGLRKWKVTGFPKMLIFYTPSTTGVRVIRVLHAAQDWWSLLDVD